MGIKKKPYGSKSITTNGTHDVSWKKEAVVNVSGSITTQEKTVTENGTVLPDAGFDALTQVNVNVPQLDTSDADAQPWHIVRNKTAYVNGVKLTGTLPVAPISITQNGNYQPPSYGSTYFSSVNVNVQPNTEERTFTENGTYYPSEGMDGIHAVNVNVPQLDTSDATAQAYQLVYGQTAYVNGQKITGTLRTTTRTFTENGTYSPSDFGVNVFSGVTVNVPTMEVVTGTFSMTSYNKDMTIPALIGKSNVILYQTGADINSGCVQLFKCVNGTVDTYYYTTSSSKIVANRIGGTFTSSTGKVSSGTTEHRFGITTYTYFAW